MVLCFLHDEHGLATVAERWWGMRVRCDNGLAVVRYAQVVANRRYVRHVREPTGPLRADGARPWE